MTKQRKTHILLGILLFFASFTRIYLLDSIPSGFFCDEASIAYNAYSIMTTGKDEHGEVLPVFFKAFGEYKGPVAIYATIPFVWFVGLTESSVRLQSAFFGVITIFFLFLLGKEFYGKRGGFIIAMVATTTPWLIHYNRTGFELNSYTAFFVAMIYFFIKATKERMYIIPAFITAAVGLYTYYSAKLLVPIMLIYLLVLLHKKLLQYKKDFFIGLSIFLMFSIPFILSFTNGQSLARFENVGLFAKDKSFIEITNTVVDNYLYQLSPMFFIEGDSDYQFRHLSNGLKPLLYPTIPFFYLGILLTLFTLKKLSSRILVFWILIYPIAAAVVTGPPFSGRTIIGAPLSAILIGLGILTTVTYLKKYIPIAITASLLGTFVIGSFLSFTHFYFTAYPLYSSGYNGWQYGPKEIILYFQETENNYDEQYMIADRSFNAGEIFFKFYAPGGCSKCKLGNPSTTYNPNLKQLFAVSTDYVTSHPNMQFSVQKIIYYPNKEVAFYIGEVVK